MNKIAIFGLGAIGSVLTKYLLVNKKNQLFFFNRSPLKEIQIIFEGQIQNYSIELERSSEVKFDWMIVCLKTYHIPGAKNAIKQLVGPETKLVVFRNGLALASDFQDILPSKNILETIIDCPIQQQSNETYLQLRLPKIILPNCPLAKEFNLLFESTGIDLRLMDKFKQSQWKKLIESAALGALQVLHEKPCLIFKNPKIKKEYLKLVQEGIAVANSDGVNISTKFKSDILKKLESYPDTKSSSMLIDHLAGRQLELDAKIGAILKIAKENGIDIPNSRKIYNQLKSF